MEGGDPIKRIQVTVKSAYPPKTGTNEYGDWSIQSAMLQDDTGTIRGSFFNAPQNLKNFVGQTLTVTSGKDAKGKISGMTAFDYEDRKKSTVTRQIEARGEYTFDEAVPGASGVSLAASGPQSNGGSRLQATYVDEKGVSIEKQVALKAAVEIAIATSVTNSAAIVKQAGELYAFFKPEVKEEKQPEPEAESETKTV